MSPHPFKQDDLEAAHTAALEAMEPEQLLAMARELLASRIRHEAAKQKSLITRRESLDIVFQAELDARDQGAEPRVDFFLPIDNDFPEAVLAS